MNQDTTCRRRGFCLAEWLWRVFRQPFEFDAVRGYIASQREHHRKRTFQEELRTLLEKHGVEYDERYIWD
jgi:hypothetical protein